MSLPEKKITSQLSTVSKLYDFEGKGHLSDEQKMLRNMGVEGESARDFLSKNASKFDAAELKEFVERQNEIRIDNKDLLRSQQELLKDNKKLKRNQILLVVATILMGIATIVAVVIAVKSTQVTVVSTDGMLVDKDTGRDVVIKSKGTHVVVQQQLSNGEESPYDVGDIVDCMSFENAAVLYKAFVDGTNSFVFTDDSAVTGIDYDGTIGLPAQKVMGSKAFVNDTHITIGDMVINISPDNPCNNGGASHPHGSRQLFFEAIRDSGMTWGDVGDYFDDNVWMMQWY